MAVHQSCNHSRTRGLIGDALPLGGIGCSPTARDDGRCYEIALAGRHNTGVGTAHVHTNHARIAHRAAGAEAID